MIEGLYVNQVIASIGSAKKREVIKLDESQCPSGLLYKVLPSLSNRRDLSLDVIFSYDGEKFVSRIPAETNITQYIKEDNTTDIDKIVEDHSAKLL